MNTIVEDIVAAIEAQILALLPTYTELQWKYLPDKNNYFNNALKFGVIPSAGFSQPTTIKNVSVNQAFTIILTNDYVNSNDTDSAQQEAIFELYKAINDIYVNIEGKKLGVNEVLDISLGTIEAPFFLEEQSVCILTTDFNILYRSPFA